MARISLKVLLGFIVCFLLVLQGISLAQDEQTQEQTQTQTEEAQQPAAEETPEEQPAVAGVLPTPLEAEMVVAEHWSKNPYPRTVGAGSRVHIVEKGDTLWDLAQRYYTNPLLWPQIWEANSYIPNAHWIYPGDPIVIPPLTPVTEEQLAETPAPAIVPEEVPTAPTGPSILPPAKREYPIALDLDLYCSGFVTKDADNWNVKIIGNEENVQRISLAQLDIVYINRGEAEGVSPGDEFTIVHKLRKIEHPIDLHSLGDYAVQRGRLKVVATQEHTSTAQITYSCDSTLVGDFLIPFQPREVPVFTEYPPIDRYSSEGPNLKGYLVFTKDDLGSVGLGHEVLIDLGAKDGIAVGTRLVLYRPNSKGYEGTGFEKDIPRRVLGEMVVFSVQDTTSTGRVIQSFDFVKVGDRVEVR